MTVRELIERLRACDPDATVLLADWNEEYLPPSAEAAARPPVAGPDVVVLGALPPAVPR